MPAPFCNNCIFWEKVTSKAGRDIGICRNDSVREDVRVDQNNTIEQNDGTFWTYEYFGCVHFRDRPTVLMEFNKLPDENE